MKNLILLITLISMAVFAVVLTIASNFAQDETSELINTQWELVSYGSADAQTEVLPEATISLEFMPDHQAGGSAGCNSYGGIYQVEGDVLTFSEVFSTMMACLADGIMEQEAAYLAALQTAQLYEISGSELTIWFEGGELHFVNTAQGLVGSAWQLESYGTEDDMTEVSGAVTIEFQEDGQAVGNGGCNSFNATYTFEDDSISFEPVVSTRMACEDVMEQESAFFAALESAERYAMTEDTLMIWYEDGQQLQFARVSPELAGTRWQLESISSQDTSTSIVTGSMTTIEFLDDEQVAGNSGCNSYGGTYQVEGENITFVEIISTLMACADTALMEQETVFLEALRFAERYEIEDEMLTIWFEGGQLHFVSIGMAASSSETENSGSSG